MDNPTVTHWEHLRAGADVEVDIRLSDGWRFTFGGSWWYGYYQLYRGGALLMADGDDFETAADILLANAAARQEREAVFGFPMMTHLVYYDYQIGDWALTVAAARDCQPRPADEVERLARYPNLTDFERHYDCRQRNEFDWVIRHQDGFRVTGTNNSPTDALYQAILEIGAYEDV